MEPNEKLELWRSRYRRAEAAYSAELSRMDTREAQYLGQRSLRSLVPGDSKISAPHVRNIISEMIETQVDSTIPQPRVTAIRECDRELARRIEDMLRNELNRLPFESLNDMMERTVPLQGCGFFLVEWDSRAHTRSTTGELSVSVIHPKQVIPQEGVTGSIADMDYFFVRIPQTKEYLARRYHVNPAQICDDGETENPDELVTAVTAYYRGEDGRIGLYTWAGDTELCDMEDYQSLRGEPEVICLTDGTAVTPEPYSPDLFPLVAQKNISVFGRFCGESDADKVADQQNTINRMESKIIDKLLRSGSYLTLPDNASITSDAEDMKVIRPGSAADKAMIDVYNLEGKIDQDLLFLEQVYQEGRQIIGITDSYQGRADGTAISGRAKQFAANQSAGRFRSKRVQKEAAYAQLFELMFRFRLAYACEPRPVVSRDMRGNTCYGTFDRRDFLEQDETGSWYFNDRFLFSCDSSVQKNSDRETLWNQARENLTSGAYGDPSALSTLILFWSKMEELDYPGAGDTRAYLMEQSAEREAPSASLEDEEEVTII